MYDMISAGLYKQYTRICILCTSRIRANNIICDVCFGYLNGHQCKRILELRDGNIPSKL